MAISRSILIVSLVVLLTSIGCRRRSDAYLGVVGDTKQSQLARECINDLASQSENEEKEGHALEGITKLGIHAVHPLVESLGDNRPSILIMSPRGVDVRHTVGQICEMKLYGVILPKPSDKELYFAIWSKGIPTAPFRVDDWRQWEKQHSRMTIEEIHQEAIERARREIDKKRGG